MNVWSCPDGFTIPSADMDFRPGGAFHCHMRSPDGEDHRLQGVYREIVPNERLVFTHVWLDGAGRPGHETLVTVTFADHGDKTRMTFHQGEFSSVASRDGHASGWNQCFDKLATYISER